MRAVSAALAAFVLVRGLVLAGVLVAARADGRSGWGRLTAWDARWYASIAAHGYGLARPDGGRILSDYAFFPLYPAVEAVGSWWWGVTPVVAGLVVSAVAGLVAAGGIWAVAREQGLDGRAAAVSVVLWAVVPMGVVESMAYSESLFVALASWALWCLLRERWWGAGLCACGAALTRPQGVAVVAAVLVALCVPATVDARRTPRRAAAALALAGWLGYLGWVGLRRGSWDGYLDVTREWGNTFDGGAAFARWVLRLLTSGSYVAGVSCLLGLLVLAGLVVALVRRRPPLPVTTYVAVLVVMALTTSWYFGSKPRYLLPAFPLLFPVGAWLAARGRATVAAVLASLVTASTLFAAWWLLGPGPP